MPRPGPGGRQAVQGEGGGPEPLDLLPVVAFDGLAGAHHPQQVGGKRLPRPAAAHNAVDAKNSHTAATTPAATSHQGQPNSSWAATPTTAPTTVAAR